MPVRSQPFFSIITCTYNSGKFLQCAIDSVTQQTFPSYEHIIVDAYSTDDTKKNLEHYRAQYSNTVQLLQQKPAGIAAAMNMGAHAARGHVLSFLNADDLYATPTVLEDVFQSFQQFPDRDWYIGDQDFIDEQGTILKHYATPAYSYDLLKRTNYIPHQATFIKKALLSAVGGFGNYRYGMDYDVWLKIGADHAPIQTHQTIARFRQHSQSITMRQRKRAELELYRIRRHVPRSLWIRCKDLVNLTVSLMQK